MGEGETRWWEGERTGVKVRVDDRMKRKVTENNVFNIILSLPFPHFFRSASFSSTSPPNHRPAPPPVLMDIIKFVSPFTELRDEFQNHYLSLLYMRGKFFL